MKEFFRKKLVYLKRKPQIIPMLFIVLACVIFTFNLSWHSGSVMRFSSKSRIAFCMFVVTLSSIMAIITYLGFKRYDKSAIVPLIITVALLVLQLVLQAYYLSVVNAEMNLVAHNEEITNQIQTSVNATYAHIVFLALALISIAVLPVYKKLLQKINTTPKTQVEQSEILVIDEKIYLADTLDD